MTANGEASTRLLVPLLAGFCRSPAGSLVAALEASQYDVARELLLGFTLGPAAPAGGSLNQIALSRPKWDTQTGATGVKCGDG